MFETLTREPTLTGRVVNQLEALIVDQRLQPGDRLPAINELTQQFGVSRTVIREAIGALAARGLLEVRHGSRTVVSRPSAQGPMGRWKLATGSNRWAVVSAGFGKTRSIGAAPAAVPIPAATSAAHSPRGKRIRVFTCSGLFWAHFCR